MHQYKLGFGTEYEKFVLRDIIGNLIHELEIRSVCEYPSNNLMGNNSEVFEVHGIRVDRLSRLRHDRKEKYDLVWNFCEFEKTENSAELIKNMWMLSRKYVFIVTQNNRNVGVLLHRIYHIFRGKKWDHGSVTLMSIKPALKFLKKHERIIKIGYFDIPWFVLDVYECGDLLKKFVPSFLVSSKNLRESKLEWVPNFIKSWLAHHSYLLCEK